MQLKYSLIAAAAAMVLVSVGGDARATGAPAIKTQGSEQGTTLQQGQSLATEDASRLAAPEKKPLIKFTGAVFDHVMIEEVNTGFIVPCVRVLTKLLKKAQKDDSIGLELRLIYTSGGNVIQRLFVVPLSEYRLTTHHSQPKKKKWKLVDIDMDVSSAMPDSGTTFNGHARIVDLGTPTSSLDLASSSLDLLKLDSIRLDPRQTDPSWRSASLDIFPSVEQIRREPLYP